MNIPDINPFLSTIASCSSTIVAIIGGFIASRLIEISTQRREAIIKLKEISDEVKFKQERISKIEKSLLCTEAEDFVLSHISEIMDGKSLDNTYEQSTKNLYTVKDFKPYWDRATDVITKFSEVQEPIILNEDGIPTSLCSELDKFEYEVARAIKHELDARRPPSNPYGINTAAILPYQSYSVMDDFQKQKDEEELAQLKASNEWLLIQQKNLENKKLSLTKPKGMKSGLIIFAFFSALCIIGPLLYMNSGVDANNAKLAFSILFIMGILTVFLYLVSFLK